MIRYCSICSFPYDYLAPGTSSLIGTLPADRMDLCDTCTSEFRRLAMEVRDLIRSKPASLRKALVRTTNLDYFNTPDERLDRLRRRARKAQ
jgi:hypothetical protein